MNHKLIVLLYLFVTLFSCAPMAQENNNKDMLKNNKEIKLNSLTAEEKAVIINKGTERPFIGVYDKHWEAGTYNCKQCDASLYKSSSKFDGHCGWPAFDDEIDGAVKRIADADGRRTEIVCAKCNGHLGHVFLGERFTEKNVRHCVNSISLKFEPQKVATETKKTAHFGGGCFWGMEYFFNDVEGVYSAKVGYMGGQSENPTYKEVCTGTTGHYEVIEVEYDSEKVSYETLARLFFEIHDPTQTNGQGPDIGEQYLSVAYYADNQEKIILEKLIQLLENKGYKVATKLFARVPFWEAEDYHQQYYSKNGKRPYCHAYTKRF